MDILSGVTRLIMSNIHILYLTLMKIQELIFIHFHSTPLIQHFMLWNSKILVLRKARIYAEEGMRRLAQFMVLPQIREFVDNFPKGNPTTHYFYHHCHILRYIEALNPHLIQPLGFNAEYHHYNPVGPEGHRNNRRIRKPNQPVNPLLTVEEDEFLYHCAIVFEALRLVDIAGGLIGV